MRTRFVAVVAAVVLGVGLLAGPAAGQEPPTTPSTAPPTTPSSTSSTTSSTVPSSTTPSSTTSTTAPVPGSTTSTVPTTTVPDESTTTTSTEVDPNAPPPSLDADQLAVIDHLESAYEEASSEEIELLQRYLDALRTSGSLGEQVQALSDSLGVLQGELAAAESRVDAALTRQQAAEDRLGEASALLDQEEAQLRDQAVNAYIGGGATTSRGADVLLRSTSLDELGKTIVYTDAVVADQRALVARVRDLRDQVQTLEQQADDAYREAVAARDEVATREGALRAQRDEQSRLQQAVTDAALAQQQLLNEVSAKRASFAQAVAVLGQTSDGISSTLATLQAGQTLPVLTAGIFQAPVQGAKITSLFGLRVDPFFGIGRMHNGVDLSAPSGTPIRASADGVVVIAGEQGGYGLCTVIDHGSGLGTLYGHQSVLAVKTGDVVTRGQVIGFVGSTGRSTGPHLHWEVRRYGQPVDPLPFMGPG